MKKAETEAFLRRPLLRKAEGNAITAKKQSWKEVWHIRHSDPAKERIRDSGIIQEVLEQEGIPAYVDTGGRYFDNLEVSVFINLLKTIDNKKQDVPLLSILRSSIFDFSINDLALIRCEYREGSYFNALLNYHKEGKDEALSRQCGLVLNRLEEWKRQARLLAYGSFYMEINALRDITAMWAHCREQHSDRPISRPWRIKL